MNFRECRKENVPNAHLQIIPSSNCF